MGRPKINISIKDAVELYKIQKLSLEQTGKELNCGAWTVSRRLHEHNISIRSQTEHLKNIPLELKGEILEILEAHMLGDGHVSKIVGINCNFVFASKHYNYTKLVSKTLELLEPSKIKKREQYRKGKLCTSYRMYTKCLIPPEYRYRWYPDNIKIIPNDLILTPTVCLYWYLDDGSLDRRDGRIKFSTNSFTEQNLSKIILPQLEQILDCKNGEIKICLIKSTDYQPVIFIPRRFTKRFLNYIGDCPIKEFEYKWAIRPYKNKGYKYL